MKKNLVLLVSILLEMYLAVESTKLVTFSIGGRQNDFTERQMESARRNDVDVKYIDVESDVLKMEEFNVMRDYLQTLQQDQKDTVVMFVESGSLFLNSSEEIVKRFKTMDAKVVLSADIACRPDPSLNVSYPTVPLNEKRFVGKKGLLGSAKVLLEVLNVEGLNMIKDLQYYLTKVFINFELREKFAMKLDTKSEIFQNLEESYEEVSVEHTPVGTGLLYNVRTKAMPTVVQPGAMKVQLESLTNYLGRSWDPLKGCQHCKDNSINLKDKNVTEYPVVTLAIFLDQPTPFLNEFFFRVSNLSYPKSRIHLFLSNMVPSQDNIVRGFLDNNMDTYSTLEFVDPSHNSSSADRRILAMSHAKVSSEYILLLDALVQLTSTNTLESLMTYNKSVVAPLVSRRGQLWSNFWGDLNSDGYYRRSSDYFDIVNGVKRGLWKVPHINHVYLIKTAALSHVEDTYAPLQPYPSTELDMLFSANMRASAMTMWLANEEMYGYMINVDSTTTEHLHNDLWEIFSNPEDWKEKYIHPEYEALIDKDFQLSNFTQPCTDVFWWPLLSETFAKQLIEEMEFFGQWSDGSNKDKRLEGGYENVPTRDIHMRQVNWEKHWMQVLQTYVYPIQLKLFQGYNEEPRARMNFVVRYKPMEQDRLRPHHDASSYTLNIALNKPGVDYEGGGAKYNRYNCAVTKSRVGWVLMSPGRVTHIHEGLPTTKGTRYIFVTFINP